MRCPYFTSAGHCGALILFFLAHGLAWHNLQVLPIFTYSTTKHMLCANSLIVYSSSGGTFCVLPAHAPMVW